MESAVLLLETTTLRKWLTINKNVAWLLLVVSASVTSVKFDYGEVARTVENKPFRDKTGTLLPEETARKVKVTRLSLLKVNLPYVTDLGIEIKFLRTSLHYAIRVETDTPGWDFYGHLYPSREDPQETYKPYDQGRSKHHTVVAIVETKDLKVKDVKPVTSWNLYDFIICGGGYSYQAYNSQGKCTAKLDEILAALKAKDKKTDDKEPPPIPEWKRQVCYNCIQFAWQMMLLASGQVGCKECDIDMKGICKFDGDSLQAVYEGRKRANLADWKNLNGITLTNDGMKVLDIPK